MDESAYQTGAAIGLAAWTQDEAGPYQTRPYVGASWQFVTNPAKQSHEFFRNGTAKLLTLLSSCFRTGARERRHAHYECRPASMAQRRTAGYPADPARKSIARSASQSLVVGTLADRIIVAHHLVETAAHTASVFATGYARWFRCMHSAPDQPPLNVDPTMAIIIPSDLLAARHA